MREKGEEQKNTIFCWSTHLCCSCNHILCIQVKQTQSINFLKDYEIYWVSFLAFSIKVLILRYFLNEGLMFFSTKYTYLWYSNKTAIYFNHFVYTYIMCICVCMCVNECVHACVWVYVCMLTLEANSVFFIIFCRCHKLFVLNQSVIGLEFTKLVRLPDQWDFRICLSPLSLSWD